MKIIKILILLLTPILYFACQKCEPIEMVPCGGSEEKPLVDLIVLINQKSSLEGIADSIRLATRTAIEKSIDKCNADLRIEYLGVDGLSSSTPVFLIPHREYLNTLKATDLILAGDIPPIGLAVEQGANAIEDLSACFDWRLDACKAIFYISDDELDGCCPFRIGDDPSELANETNETNKAIAVAQSNEVAVFSHLIDRKNLSSEMFNLYESLSKETNGMHTKSTIEEATVSFYENLLPDIICNACNGCALNDLTK